MHEELKDPVPAPTPTAETEDVCHCTCKTAPTGLNPDAQAVDVQAVALAVDAEINDPPG